ncbi:hydantoinase/oxoprolinase family protein, partial [Vibrio breoganii]|uniref:hydantoinase/oxoprolinase family protein n=1 Tax=Vibrio breoganii TaxID=553239 RepID=UPI000370F036
PADIGALVHGYPRESSIAVELGEVRTNFRMPDILALAIGGGTVVREQEQGYTLGPDSVGHELLQKGKSFGGETLTLTDVALTLDKMQWHADNKPQAVELSEQSAETIYQQMIEVVEEGIDKMKTSAAQVPVILVGGGSALLPDEFVGVSEVVRPENFEVANAIGVALGEISGQLDKIVPIAANERQQVLDALEQDAKHTAIEAGACPESVSVIERSEIPLSYFQGNMVHVKIKAAGKIA